MLKIIVLIFLLILIANIIIITLLLNITPPPDRTADDAEQMEYLKQYSEERKQREMSKLQKKNGTQKENKNPGQ